MLTEQQLKERATGIGGSDAATVAGLNPYKTPSQLFLEKLGLSANEDLSANEAVHWGNVLEPVLADEYARRTGEALQKQDKLLRSEKYPWMIANIDRLITGKNAILECKTAGLFKNKEWGEEGSDQIPESYLLQCAHYAIVCDCSYVDTAVLIGGQQFKVYRYERDRALEKNLIEIERNFWNNHVLKQDPPAPITYEDCSSLWKRDNKTSVEADAKILKELQAYKYLKDRIKVLEQEMQESKVTICNYIKDRAVLLGMGGTELATWKSQETTRFDSKGFEKAYPALYQQFTKKNSFRVFRTKGE